jgi:hypothetical protein
MRRNLHHSLWQSTPGVVPQGRTPVSACCRSTGAGIFSTKEETSMNNNYTQLSKLALPLLLLGITASVALGQGDPFSSLGQSAQTISTGTFATGLIEMAIVVGGLLLAFSGRVLGGLLIAIIGGGMMALSATKWMGWIQGL